MIKNITAPPIENEHFGIYIDGDTLQLTVYRKNLNLVLRFPPGGIEGKFTIIY